MKDPTAARRERSLKRTREQRERRRILWMALETKYAPELAAAGTLKRVWIRYQMSVEYRRELEKPAISPKLLLGLDESLTSSKD